MCYLDMMCVLQQYECGDDVDDEYDDNDNNNDNNDNN